ncbi:hypothetical protein [Streptomyces nigra]|uniref:hypothetical protein n=1 Tax=Streptomyces nigra TaxID=1827580 RepID=UPI0037177731
MLTLAFRDVHAVGHLMGDTERMSLLVGDGTVPSGAEVEVPIMNDLAAFTGDFVLDTDRAWDLVRSFTQTRVAGSLGESLAALPDFTCWLPPRLLAGSLSLKRAVRTK